MEKQCFKCFETKPLNDFYRHPHMADGYMGKCKICTKRDVKEHREENLDRIRAYDRGRHNNEAHREKVRESYRKRTSDPEKRTHEWKKQQEWRDRNRLKRAAHILIGHAIAHGIISKKDVRCERCGSDQNLDAHHEDYHKPLEINWLCKLCHDERHRELNEARRKNAGVT